MKLKIVLLLMLMVPLVGKNLARPVWAGPPSGGCNLGEYFTECNIEESKNKQKPLEEVWQCVEGENWQSLYNQDNPGCPVYKRGESVTTPPPSNLSNSCLTGQASGAQCSTNTASPPPPPAPKKYDNQSCSAGGSWKTMCASLGAEDVWQCVGGKYQYKYPQRNTACTKEKVDAKAEDVSNLVVQESEAAAAAKIIAGPGCYADNRNQTQADSLCGVAKSEAGWICSKNSLGKGVCIKPKKAGDRCPENNKCDNEKLYCDLDRVPPTCQPKGDYPKKTSCVALYGIANIDPANANKPIYKCSPQDGDIYTDPGCNNPADSAAGDYCGKPPLKKDGASCEKDNECKEGVCTERPTGDHKRICGKPIVGASCDISVCAENKHRFLCVDGKLNDNGPWLYCGATENGSYCHNAGLNKVDANYSCQSGYCDPSAHECAPRPTAISFCDNPGDRVCAGKNWFECSEDFKLRNLGPSIWCRGNDLAPEGAICGTGIGQSTQEPGCQSNVCLKNPRGDGFDRCGLPSYSRCRDFYDKAEITFPNKPLFQCDGFYSTNSECSSSGLVKNKDSYCEVVREDASCERDACIGKDLYPCTSGRFEKNQGPAVSCIGDGEKLEDGAICGTGDQPYVNEPKCRTGFCIKHTVDSDWDRCGPKPESGSGSSVVSAGNSSTSLVNGTNITATIQTADNCSPDVTPQSTECCKKINSNNIYVTVSGCINPNQQ